ncbi:hypothetical protein [Ralstonia pseudosolanacearum]|uniref:hypothetical protein n=1 Tax=Ralstonia pseudosolanacearum TaxID=1310165 RepID=UPI001F394DF2|nr:hypothetical protein [Ralstonia pseudosolanacearum]
MINFAMSASELGEVFSITPRRVAQYRDDKLLPTIERGKFDVAWLLWLRKGEQRAAKLRNKPDRDTLVALGWLGGVNDEPSDDDLAAFGKLFERNGFTSDASLLAVGRATGLLNR